jgi:hypothetical protein
MPEHGGEIKGFTGVDDPYEDPKKADLVVDAEKQSEEYRASDCAVVGVRVGIGLDFRFLGRVVLTHRWRT